MKILFFAILFLVAAVASADDDSQREQLSQGTIADIQNIQKTLRDAGVPSPRCEEIAPDSCSFEAECRILEKNKDNTYLYKNAEGRTLPNYALYQVYNSLNACMSSDENIDPIFMNQDPFMNPTMFADANAAGGDEQLKKNQQQLQQAEARAKVIFKDTQARIIKVLEARKNGLNNDEVDAMENRVKTIQLTFPPVNKDPSDLAAHGCEMPNAFYREDSHQFWVCPQILNMPDAALQATMAHELGHSIDPCNSRQNLVQTSPGYSVNFALDKSKDALKTAFPLLTLADNPTATVVQCLQSKDSVGAEVPSASAFQKTLQDQIADLEGHLKETYRESDRKVLAAEISQQKGILARVTADNDRYKFCGELTKNGDVQESFADWVSSSVLAGKVSEIQRASAADAKRFAFESAGVFMSLDCPGMLAAQQKRVETLLDKAGRNCGMVLAEYDFLKDRSHPDSGKRVTRIYLAQPNMDKALGCKPTNVKLCQ